MVLSLELDVTGSLLIAVIVLLVGRFVQHRVKVLEKYFIPAPVIGGFIFSILVTVGHYTQWLEISFNPRLANMFMLIFFATVGFSATLKFLKKGGKIVLLFLLCAVILLFLQNFLGVTVAFLMGKSAAFGMATASIPMSGGHGTAAAFGPILESKFNVNNATTIAIAAATVGLFMGSIIGGPVGNLLMKKYKLKAKVAVDDKAESNEFILAKDKEIKITEEGIFQACVIIAIAIGCGAVISNLINKMEIILPGYIGAMFVAAVIRNFADFTNWIKVKENELEIIGNISLSLFLVMALMQMKLWVLADLAIPIIVLLIVQILLMFFYAYFVTFRILGKNYDAAVMACGHCGFGLGATPNAVANMEAFTAQNFPSPQAFFVLPLVGALFIDFINSGMISMFLNFIH